MEELARGSQLKTAATGRQAAEPPSSGYISLWQERRVSSAVARILSGHSHALSLAFLANQKD